MKKRFFTLFTLCLAFSAMAQRVQVGDLYYKLNSSDNTAEVTSKSARPTNNSYPNLTSVIIPETIDYNGNTYSVMSIGYHAFYGCTSLNSVTIPNSVTSIGGVAFHSCSGLTSVTIGNSVTSIGYHAFYGCSSLPVENNLRYADTYLVEAVDKTLSTYSIKEGTKWIGDRAFDGCSSLTSITIPNSVTSIGEYTFYYCSSLASVTIPNSVTSIGNYAFSSCSSLTSVTLPNSVMEIGNGAFRECSGLLTPVYNAHCFAYMPTSYKGAYTIPEGIEQIAGGAFYNCSSLTAITIPNSVTSIGESALMYCGSITSISIPSSVASIGSFVLAFCDALVAISVDPTNTIYDSRENCNGIIETKTNSLVAGCQTTILPNSLETIKCGAMSCCRNLGSVYIPKSVTTIETASFCSCASLVSIVVDKDNPMYDSRNNCNAIIESSTDNLITGCQKTIIPHDVISIHDSAFFGCTSLSSIVIPHNVKSIGEDAFYFCTGLASVTFGNNLTTIGERAFYNSNNIKSIYCYAINPPEIYDFAFSFYYSNPTLYVPCEALPDYQEQWGQFTTIECIASEEAETEEVVIELGTTTVIITWPTEEGADTYTIVIKKDGEVVCTLTFNSEGQLISIAFAPGRDGNHPAQYAEAVANGKGFRFTVTGLEDGTDYTYDITVKNEANQVIKTHSGKFTTEPYSAVDNTYSQSSNTNCQKLFRNGQLIILCDGVEYNAMGAEIR